jgi:hypothetical protein|tara:strand:+ start:324 stop:1337 length:1014 start_codon:yes stop_codon:yes gene_type:complete
MSLKTLEPEDFVVSSDSITSTLWSTGTPVLTEFHTSSVQLAGSSGDYYLTVYQTASSQVTSTPQFEIAYADKLGSGSALFNSSVPEKSPSLSIYGQYRSMILEDENKDFIFGSSNNILTAENFWVINFDRARYKEQIFAGSLNLSLSGSAGIINLTDDSKDNPVNRFLGSSKFYQLISGSNGTAGTLANSGYVAGSGSYGLVFPELGTILLNPQAISQSIHVDAARSSNSNDNNPLTLFDSIKLASSFQVNSEETITSDYVFIRARNSEFNYSENPSFISGSTGEVIFDEFINHPQVYATTVGMYNNSNELVAVAKLSKPLLKDFTKEALVRVKLDF